MHNQSERDKLMEEYRELLKKKREATTEEEKKHFKKLAIKKYDEMLICQFGGDKNLARFNRF